MTRLPAVFRKAMILFAFFCLGAASVHATSAGGARAALDEGIGYYQDELYYKAIDSFRSALEVNPYYGDAYKYLAQAYLMLGETRLALENALLALKYSNDDPEVLLIVANTYRADGDYRKSEEYYRKILERFPSDSGAYRELGDLYLRMNRLQQARNSLDKSERLNPGNWRTLITSGDYWSTAGDATMAEAQYKKAFNQNPRERTVYIALADFYQKQERYTESIRVLEAGEKLFDNFYSGVSLLAEDYLRSGDFTKASEKLLWMETQGLVRDSQKKAWLYYRIALASETVAKDRALDYYRKAMAADTGNQFILQCYENFLIRNFHVDAPERMEVSGVYYRKAMENLQRGENILFYLNLKKAVFLYPFDTEARNRLISYYESRNDFYLLYQELQSLARIDPATRIRDKIENLEWKRDTGRLRVEKPDLRTYNGVVLVDSDFYNMPDVYRTGLLFAAQYYPKFKFQPLDYRKRQGVNYILDFLRKNDLDFYVLVSHNQSKNLITFTLNDKTGQRFDEFQFNFGMRNTFESQIAFLEWISREYPAIFILGQEASPDLYRLSAGTWLGVTNAGLFTVFRLDDAGMQPLSVLKVTKAEPWYSELRLQTNLVKLPDRNLEDQTATSSALFSRKLLTKYKRILGY
jgi:tetratricopeptide (TPR) repeat protein